MINLKNKINNKKAKVCVIGLGYVGFPLLQLIHKSGFKTIGIDNDKNKIKKFKLKKLKNTVFTANYSLIKNSDIIIFTLPTPINRQKKPDLKILKNSVFEASKYLKDNQLVIFESTSYPGTTKECTEILKDNSLKKIWIAYSPERVDPGNKKFDIKNITKIVSADSVYELSLIDNFYKKIFKKIVNSSDIKTAEMAKIFENIFRSVNIGLVNEMKQISKKLKINFIEVLKLAETKPFGFMKFLPGPGVGGHCIPVDPYYLNWIAKKNNVSSRFIELSGEINNNMPSVLFNEISTNIKKLKIAKKPKLLFIGLSYKKNINDYRNSPALKIFEKFANKKIFELDYNDNFITNIKVSNKKYISKKINYQKLDKYDSVILLTDHDYINYKKLLKYSKLILDCRNKYYNEKNVINL